MSDSPALHSRWLLLLKLDISSIVHYCFIIPSPTKHNRYKLAERKISRKNTEYMLNYSFPCSCSNNLSSYRFIIKQQWTIEEISIFSNSSHLEWRVELSDTILLNQITLNLAGMVLGWVPFKILSDKPTLHSRWLLLLKIEMSSIVHCCFSISPSWMEGGTVGHNCERDPPCQVWFNLVQRVQRKRFKCDLLSKYA
jgi:hypothetical protein